MATDDNEGVRGDARTCSPPSSPPSTLNPQNLTLNTQHSTLNPQVPMEVCVVMPALPHLLALKPQPSTLNPPPYTLNTQHSTLNTQHSTLHPQPSGANGGVRGDAGVRRRALVPVRLGLLPHPHRRHRSVAFRSFRFFELPA